jgi:PleD family two-component response regulator
VRRWLDPRHPKRDPEVAVLVVDAVPNLVERRTTTLEGHGFQVYTAADGPAALDRASAAPPDVSPVSAVTQAGWRSQSTKRLVERMR